MYTVEQRGSLVRKYWQTGSFKTRWLHLERNLMKDVHHRSFASWNWLKGYRQGEADLTPADFFLCGLLKGKLYKNTPPHNRTTQRRSTPRDSRPQLWHFGKSIPKFGETHFTERRPFSASVMSRSCFAPFPVSVYTFSSHYLNIIIFYKS